MRDYTKYMYFLVLFFIYTNTLTAQNYAIDNMPKELRSRASAVIRDEHISIDMKNESNITQTVTKAITILNQSGLGYSELLLYYDKSKSIKDIKGQILDEFGQQVSKFSQKDFKDYSATGDVNMFDDVRVKHFSPNVTTFPFTVVYSYEIKHNQNLFIPYWRPNFRTDLAVQKSTYQFTTKNNFALRIKTENIDQNPVITENDKGKTYTWTVSNIKAQKAEPFAPIQDKNEIVVKIVPEEFFYFKKRGKVTNWKEFGKWVYDDLLRDKQDLPASTVEKARQITANASSPQEKAKILYEYMQNKTRYISIQVGIGGLEPFPASYVDRLGYGDCKALVNYMQALLHAVDIPSLYCIVEAGNQKVSLDESFANAVDGNHIILAIPFGKDTTWLECTSNRHPFGYIGDFTDDRLVLACTAEGGKVLRTKSYSFANNIQFRKGSFKVDESGSISGKMITNFAGTQFENHFANSLKSTSDQNKELLQLYNIDNISFDDFRYELNRDSTIQLIEKLTLNIRNYAVLNNNHYIFTPNLFNVSRAIPDSKNRVNPVYINRGYTDVDQLEFEFDKKISGNINPIAYKLESPMGNYELSVFAKDQKLYYKRKIQIKEGNYAPEDYQKYFDFMQKVSSYDRIKYNIGIEN